MKFSGLASGLKRWEIGDVASRIVLTREYFQDGQFQDLSLANKQLRFLARFMTVCLLLNRREMVHQLNQLKMLVAEAKRTFQETDFKEWKQVIWDITKFLKVDTAFMNIRRLRYSVVMDLDPDCIPHVACTKRKLRLRDGILCSYHPNEVKFSELTLDNFRMLQCLEWEPSGSFYQSSGITSTGAGTNTGQNGGLPGSSRINYSQEIADPTLPPNPRKANMTMSYGVMIMIYTTTKCTFRSTSGSGEHASMSPARMGNCIGDTEKAVNSIQPNMIQSDSVSTLPSCPACDSITSSLEKSVWDSSGYHSGCLNLGLVEMEPEAITSEPSLCIFFTSLIVQYLLDHSRSTMMEFKVKAEWHLNCDGRLGSAAEAVD
ncbi:hypothetical protein L6452_30196 [Arctium lappa]|uniref:Uncharacterized protein n=1 Tax=Arctium lappa TaxID=4217 RepID=A0ACB8ZI46_ARCLA|nr:hypothetical protein L6452_30196 [Arctium lappa]